jgi:murein hydrolase activator
LCSDKARTGLPLLWDSSGRSHLLRQGQRAGSSEHHLEDGLGGRTPAAAGGGATNQRPAGFDRSSRPHASRSGQALRAGLIGACVLGAVAGLPGKSAGLAPPEQSGHALNVRRLAELHEQLERRRELERSLQGQVGELARKIDDLRGRLERTSTILRSERQEALALERQLDQLVPRFLARVAEAREHRARAARTLADLAGKSRSPDLDPRMRARMSALSPLLLQRLGHSEAGLELLRERREQTIERHAQIERRLPALTTEHQRLQRLSLENLRLREAALEELRGVRTEVDLLGKEQAQVARRFLRERAATLARAEPQADQRALPDPSAMRRTPGSSAWRVASASVDKGAVDATPRVTRVAAALDRKEARVATAAAEPHAGLDASALAASAGTATRPPYRGGAPHAAFPGAGPPVQPAGSRDAIGRASVLKVAFRREDGLYEQSGGIAGSARRAAPILPLPDAAQDRVSVAHAGPELAFPAAPGQRVAAPVDGKVVFAGTFKSYGWLLILEHEREYHTLLWGFARLDVKRDDQVHVGQIVGIMDAQGDDPPVLHVERRRHGRPIDLAASSNGIQG